MADDKNSREQQARDEDRRQRKRDVAEELERGDESEPPIEMSKLADFEAELDELSFPVTGAEVIDAVGDREIPAGETTYAVAELVPEADAEAFESPAAVRERVQRPTVAGAMKRVVEAAATVPHTSLDGSQRDAYEKTFREIAAVDTLDDEGVTAIADWIVERTREKQALPGSRAVRRQAAKYCRANGYEVRNDDWLGI